MLKVGDEGSNFDLVSGGWRSLGKQMISSVNYLSENIREVFGTIIKLTECIVPYYCVKWVLMGKLMVDIFLILYIANEMSL